MMYTNTWEQNSQHLETWTIQWYWTQRGSNNGNKRRGVERSMIVNKNQEEIFNISIVYCVYGISSGKNKLLNIMIETCFLCWSWSTAQLSLDKKFSIVSITLKYQSAKNTTYTQCTVHWGEKKWTWNHSWAIVINSNHG